MFLEIVSPEAIIFSSEVESIAVPGINGEFQMLNMHAPIVSVLKKGFVKIGLNDNSNKKKLNDNFTKTDDGRIAYEINSGVLEIKDNKVILLQE